MLPTIQEEFRDDLRCFYLIKSQSATSESLQKLSAAFRFIKQYLHFNLCIMFPSPKTPRSRLEQQDPSSDTKTRRSITICCSRVEQRQRLQEMSSQNTTAASLDPMTSLLCSVCLKARRRKDGWNVRDVVNTAAGGTAAKGKMSHLGWISDQRAALPSEELILSNVSPIHPSASALHTSSPGRDFFCQ